MEWNSINNLPMRHLSISQLMSNIIMSQFTEETLNNNNNNGPVSPPHNNNFNPPAHQPPPPPQAPPQQLQQRENMQITQPCSPSSSPLASPNALHHFQLPSSSHQHLAKAATGGAAAATAPTLSATSLALVTSNGTDTADPNWQANKGTVRERNAAMFNNDLMADIKFIVGAEGE